MIHLIFGASTPIPRDDVAKMTRAKESFDAKLVKSSDFIKDVCGE